MAACWTELAKSKLIDLNVVGIDSNLADPSQPTFSHDLLKSVPHSLLNESSVNNLSHLIRLVQDFDPHVIYMGGWTPNAYRQLILSPAVKNIPLILGMDNPYRGDLRQRLGKFLLRKMVARVNKVAVTGERAWQFAKYLGVAEGRIFKGMYGVDADQLGLAYSERMKSVWPKRFVFVGRYIERKGFDILIEAFRRFRLEGNSDWALHVLGKGPLKSQIPTGVGIHDLGEVNPENIPGHLASAGVFLLPSRYDAWPLAIVEAASAGLPVLCTAACGSAVELVRHRYNGYICETGNVQKLKEALEWFAKNAEHLPVMGQRSLQMAAPWSARQWAERFEAEVSELCGA